MTQEPQQDRRATRRGVLLGVGVAGVGALAGCSTAAVPYDANLAGDAPGAATSPSASASAGAKSGGASAMGAPSGGSGSGDSGGNGAAGMSTGTLLGDVSEIPVGGGKIFTAEKVVVTQPTKGQIKVFSAVCTHVGCILDKVANGEIYCPCHGSIFKITDGSVVAGPAPRPIPAEKISVSTDGKITLQ